MVSANSMKERKRAAAERALLDAAEQELAVNAADSSMQAIAARASVSVGTLYNYFADKDALVQALLADRRAALASHIDELLAANAAQPALVQLRTLTHGVFAFFEAHRQFLQVALTTDQGPASRKRSAMALLSKRIDAIIVRCEAEGTLKKSTAPLASFVFPGIMRAVLVNGAHEKVPFTDLADLVLELFLHGAAT